MKDLIRPGWVALVCLLSGAAAFASVKISGEVTDASWIFFTIALVSGACWLIVMVDKLF